MPFNGSGTFARLYSWVVDAAGNVNISSTRTDAEMNGFAAGLTNCVTRDGQSPPSADLPMGGKKLVNLGAATVGTDALNRDTADARYLLASGATNLTLTGTLNALTGAFSGNVTVGGTLGVTGASTFTGLVTFSNLAKFANNQGILFTDASGSNPLFVSDNLGNVVLYGTNATGTNIAVFSFPTRNSNPTFSFLTPVVGLTASPGDNSTKFATTAFLVTALASYAPLASPTFTGTPAAPTAAVGTSTTQLATTAFVQAARPPIGQTITSSATVTPTFNDDFVEITAQAAGLTFANPTGSAVNMWGIVVRIKDNATPQTIAFGTQYRGVGVTLPTTTVAGKTTVLGMIFNNALTKWDVVSVAQE